MIVFSFIKCELIKYEKDFFKYQNNNNNKKYTFCLS